MPVVGYAAPGAGVVTLVWEAGLADGPKRVVIDPMAADDYTMCEMQVGWGPVLGYVRFSSDGKDIVVAECGDVECAVGTLTTMADGTESQGLPTNPAVGIDQDLRPLIAYHACAPPCETVTVHLIRCSESCAEAFPEAVIHSWDNR